jgi:putative transposase
VPTGLKRYQETRDLHFVTFTCYHWKPYLATGAVRDLFEEMLEQTRRLYLFYVSAYVVMPEHVHLLVSEPERRLLSTALQALKQAVSRRALPTLANPARVGHPLVAPASRLPTLATPARVGHPLVAPAFPLPTLANPARVGHPAFWQARYFDRNIWSPKAFDEARAYIHMNPVRRGLVENPEDWAWSSARHYLTSEKRVVEAESPWTARDRERAGIEVKFKFAHPSKTS